MTRASKFRLAALIIVSRTTESSGVEPGAVEFKFYAPGVGVVFDNDVSGKEKDSLVKVITE